MRISSDVKIDFDDVLISPKRSSISSRKEVDLIRTFKMKTNTIIGTGICSANMHTTGSFEMSKAMAKQQMLSALSKHYTIEEYIKFYDEMHYTEHCLAFFTVGMSENDRKRFKKVSDGSKNPPKLLCIDIANGYSQKFLDEVKYYRDAFPYLTILAGNVATPEMTEALLLGGADIVKVGIGSGANCLTRKVTGIGYPQLSAVIECADAAHGLDGYIMSDGGCKNIGDICKAMCAGADFVMLGGMLAAHDECNGLIEVDGVKRFEHYGMSSNKAMADHKMGKKDYRASEGRETVLPAKGELSKTLIEISGGLRSCCSYIGARNIRHMAKCAHFVRCNAHSQLNQSLSGFTVQ